MKDIEFAEKINTDYPQVPVEDLFKMSRRIRIIQDDFNRQIQEGFFKDDPISLLMKPGNPIDYFTIQTNAGPVEIRSGHAFYPVFMQALEKSVKKLDKKNQGFITYMQKMTIDTPFLLTWKMLQKYDLGPHQRQVIAGMFIIQFGLSIEKILSEAEYEDSDVLYKSYKHYLAGIVKNRLGKNFNNTSQYP